MHTQMSEAALVSAVAFVSTNIDDILILAVFFGQPRRNVLAIVTGQALGIGALVLASIVAAAAALLVPAHWLALLGLLPLALGVRQLRATQVDEGDPSMPRSGADVWTVASVTAANG